jgi:adhesin/invasin
VADGSTAVINDMDFVVGTGALANGTAPNVLSATVRDGNGNLLGAGIDVIFTVTGAATPATQTVQTDANGVATANLVSLVAAGNQVTATVAANTTLPQISTFVPLVQFTNIDTTANTHIFSISEQFPKTGFDRATFTLNMDGNPGDFTWESTDPAVTVNGGVVTLNSAPAGPVTITATLTADPNIFINYIFKVDTWFEPGSNQVNWAQARDSCMGIWSQPTVEQMNINRNNPSVRSVGALWSEWGNIQSYGYFTDAGQTLAWSSEIEQNTPPGLDQRYYTVYLNNNGFVYPQEYWNNSTEYVAICQRAL